MVKFMTNNFGVCSFFESEGMKGASPKFIKQKERSTYNKMGVSLCLVQLFVALKALFSSLKSEIEQFQHIWFNFLKSILIFEKNSD